jgi:hypothetical protein
MNRNEEIERIIRLVHDMADDHVLRECIGKALDDAYQDGVAEKERHERQTN